MALLDLLAARLHCTLTGHRVGYRLGGLRQCRRCGHMRRNLEVSR